MINILEVLLNNIEKTLSGTPLFSFNTSKYTEDIESVYTAFISDNIIEIWIEKEYRELWINGQEKSLFLTGKKWEDLIDRLFEYMKEKND